jgi:hypothetical protein
MRVDDRIRKAVVYVGRADNGPFVPYGTAFVVLSEAPDGRGYQQLVTAAHVIDLIDSDSVSVRLNDRSGRARVITLRKSHWRLHRKVDLAICPTTIPPSHFDILHVTSYGFV